MTTKLEAIDIRKSYGSHEVLKGISLTAKAGDVISVVQMNHGTGHPPSVPVLGAVRVYEPNVKANTLRWCVAIAAHRQKGLVPGQSAPPHLSCPA